MTYSPSKEEEMPAYRDIEMRDVPFVQFMLPDGRQVETSIPRPEGVAAQAARCLRAGGRFTAEVLRTQEVSLAYEFEDSDLVTAICKNGPSGPAAVDGLILAARDALAAKGRLA